MVAMLFIFDIHIDFDQSHMFFPTIILGILLLLGLCIFILYGVNFLKQVIAKERILSFFEENYDKCRLFGTFFLIFIYFLLLEPIGRIFPNTGFGFVVTSMIFIFCSSLLYIHKKSRKKIIIAGLNAIIAPLICWYILGYVFNLTLP